MRTLRFKINPASLIVKDWELWEEEDKGYIIMTARMCGCEFEGKTFAGDPYQLYGMLEKLSYRYDIEIL